MVAGDLIGLNMIKVPLIKVCMQTTRGFTLFVDVPSHEVPVIEKMFGIISEEKSGFIDVNVEDEFDRLCSKYNSNKVAEAFGNKNALSRYILDSAAIDVDVTSIDDDEQEKPQKKAKKTTSTEEV